MTKILIVENMALTALRIQTELEAKGYTVTDVATTAEDAIASIRHDEPDVVLLDFHLDRASNGATVAHFLNANHNYIPIIYLSEYSDEKTVNVIDKTRFYAYLTKPFQPNALLLTIRQALEAKQQQLPSSETITFTYEHIEYSLLSSEILWINTQPLTKGVFISTKHAENQFRIYESLKSLLINRPLSHFVQISSSYILNLDYVINIMSDGHLLIPKDYLPKERNTNLDTMQGRIFKVGKTFKNRMTDWHNKWNVK